MSKNSSDGVAFSRINRIARGAQNEKKMYCRFCDDWFCNQSDIASIKRRRKCVACGTWTKKETKEKPYMIVFVDESMPVTPEVYAKLVAGMELRIKSRKYAKS